jgi:NADPH2:quinone reductase
MVLRSDLETPTVQPGQALVRVAFAGVNAADILMRRGASSERLPYIPGVEGAGVVVAVAEDVQGVVVGDRVAWAPTSQGAAIGSYAELEAVSASQLIRVPGDVELSLAAGVVLQGLTAGYLVNDIARLGPGSTVLVRAAAGGTGRMVVQWASHLGARVIAVVSSDAKAAVALAAGADHALVASDGSVAKEVMTLTDGVGVDYIVNGVGGTTFSDDLDSAAVRGHIAVFGRVAGPPEAFSAIELVQRSITVTGGYMTNFLRTPDEIAVATSRLWEGIGQGWLSPILETVRLEQASDAHRRLESRESVGKLILNVEENLR